MIRAIGWGFGLFLALLAGYTFIVLRWPGAPAATVWLPYVCVLLGGALTGYLVKAKLFTHLTLLALAMAAAHALFNIASNELGQPTDFPGGSFIALVLSLPVILILAYVGGAV